MKAIIPAAGLGTRFLPGTKCTPKEMLPVLDKPVIQYVVEEALDPEEVDDAIIVTSPGKPELLNYFQPDRSLENLLRERGKVFTREDLMQKVWNYDYFGDMRTVDVTVRRLREKIEDDPGKPRYILTRRGVGYYFAG